MGEVRLDDEKLGRMGFRTRPNRNRRAIRWLSGNAVPLAAGSKYNFRELGAYLGNVGVCGRPLKIFSKILSDLLIRRISYKTNWP